jgi:anti-sigma B factor antagonist
MTKVHRRDLGDITVLELSGRLMGGPDAEQFHKLIREVLAQGRHRVVVDLGDVAWVNSSGLGSLIAAYTALKEAGGIMKLMRVSRRVDQILQVTKLSTVFLSYPDEDSAVRSFGP